MIEFYKETHWSNKKGKWINAASEHNYVSYLNFPLISNYIMGLCMADFKIAFTVLLYFLSESDA